MSGNVSEWENACAASDGAADACQIRGGSFVQQGSGSACDASYSAIGTTRRDLQEDFIGFRCCARPVPDGADAGAAGPVPGALCPGAAASGPGRDGGPFQPHGCPTPLHGSALVEVPAPPGSPVESYCVDATEATRADYAAFISSGVSTTGQGAVCAWNDTYAPECNWPPAAGSEQLPVGCVDWCDAAAYCKWSGKRLCGKVGGGPAPYAQTPEPVRELVNACSKEGAQSYPFGDLYDPQACVGADFDGTQGFQPGSDVPKPVGSVSTCEGPYPGLFDLSGNADEWEDACNNMTGSGDSCVTRGGGYQSDSFFLKCGALGGTGRNNHVPDLGIRCCSATL